MQSICNFGCCTPQYLEKSIPQKNFKVAIVVTALVSALFIGLAAAGQITAISASLAAVSGVLDLVLIALFCWQKCKPTPLKPSKKKLPTLIDSPPPVKKKPPTFKESPPPIRKKPSIWVDSPPIIKITPPIEEELPKTMDISEWEKRLKMSPVSKSQHEFNLVNPSEPIVEDVGYGMRALPMFGRYENKYAHSIPYPPMAVKLPPSQIRGFPKSVQNLVRKDPNLEVFFLINYDQDSESTRNLMMHHMVMPEYNPLTPTKTEAKDLEETNIGLKYRSLEVGIFEPSGVKKSYSTAHSIPIGSLKKQPIHLHGESDVVYAASPDNCCFEVDTKADTCSFYTVTRFRGRTVAFYNIFIRKESSCDGEALKMALFKPNLASFAKSLEENSFTYSSQVSALFKHYS